MPLADAYPSGADINPIFCHNSPIIKKMLVRGFCVGPKLFSICHYFGDVHVTTILEMIVKSDGCRLFVTPPRYAINSTYE